MPCLTKLRCLRTFDSPTPVVGLGRGWLRVGLLARLAAAAEKSSGHIIHVRAWRGEPTRVEAQRRLPHLWAPVGVGEDHSPDAGWADPALPPAAGEARPRVHPAPHQPPPRLHQERESECFCFLFLSHLFVYLFVSFVAQFQPFFNYLVFLFIHIFISFVTQFQPLSYLHFLIYLLLYFLCNSILTFFHTSLFSYLLIYSFSL